MVQFCVLFISSLSSNLLPDYTLAYPKVLPLIWYQIAWDPAMGRY